MTHASIEGNLAWELISVATDHAGSAGEGQQMRLRGKLPPWAGLAFFLLLGLAGIFVPRILEWQWDRGIISEIGVACLVASILGFTIDRWMRAELRTDVFLASIGHLLPQEFRAEVSRIIGYKLICEKHFLLIKIENIGNGFVRVTSAIERTIRNRSAYPQPIYNMAHMDEWGHKNVGSSEIVECILEIDGVETEANPAKIDNYSVYRATPEKTLKANQVANLRAKWVEYKPSNDDLHYSFAMPTIDPKIEVHASDDLDCIFNFGTPGENAESVAVSKYAPRKELTGTYFPHQSMRVRWWPKPQKESGPA